MPVLLMACGRKAIPAASVPSAPETPVAEVPKTVTVPPVAPIAKTKDTAIIKADTAAAPAMVYNKVMVAVDSKGIVRVGNNDLPGTFGTDSLRVLRSFLPGQVKNLAARFNAIPPRALYVPDALSKKGRRGVYYIYNRKFWYWRKSDGYFYLDSNYYE